MTQDISEQDGGLLLRLARESILCELVKKGNTLGSLENKVSKKILEESRGTFVSLHKKGNLRGCIGNIEPNKTIFNGVRENAKYAAFNDSRFSPLSHEELRDTRIEISILSCPEKLDYTDGQDLIAMLKPNIDGVMIKKQSHSATFLPQVWHQLKNPETFLSQLCLKAGLPSNQWKSGDLDVWIYQVQLFEEKE